MTVETAPRVAPAEPTTPIRPSEALRLGRLIFPVRIEGWFWDNDGGACAVGAIHAGGGLGALGGGSGGPSHLCPACGRERRVGPTVMHLNDDHHWSDDQIVAWLESLGL